MQERIVLCCHSETARTNIFYDTCDIAKLYFEVTFSSIVAVVNLKVPNGGGQHDLTILTLTLTLTPNPKCESFSLCLFFKTVRS